MLTMVTAPAAADPLAFTRATAGVVDADTIAVYVSTTGDDRPTDLEAACFWFVTASVKDGTTILSDRRPNGTCDPAGPISNAVYDGAQRQVALTVKRAAIETLIQPRAAGMPVLAGITWSAAFAGSQQVITTPPVDPAKGLFTAATAKDDADLYFSGGWTGAKGSSPIWTLDAKWDVAFPRGTGYHWFGFSGAVSLNPNPDPPADSTDMDPDSIKFNAQMDWSKPGRVFNIEAILNPIGGEYAKDPLNGNVVTSGQLAFFSRPFINNSIVFDPFVGYEIGKNIEKPDMLFKRPVDLSAYNNILRGLYGATLTGYVFQSKDKMSSDNPYLVVVSVAWQQRILGATEPYVQSQYLPDETGQITHQKVVTLERGTRGFLETSVTWSPMDLVGLTLDYKRGSLPPLFQFVNSQISLQLTFKAAFTNKLIRPKTL